MSDQAELLIVKNSNGTKFKNKKLASGWCDVFALFQRYLMEIYGINTILCSITGTSGS